MRLAGGWELFRGLLAALVALGVFAQVQAADEKVTIPDPEDIVLETKDGVAIHGTFYGGVLKKKAVPFLMVHGWDGNRGQYDRFAKELQKRGNAVLAIDLRGHGESVYFKGDESKKIDPSRFNKVDLERMVLDLEAAKKYLMDLNNTGDLNIEALCVVAAQEGAIPALKWTAADWSAPQLPAFKQGQDVKAVVLLSPVLSFKGDTALLTLTHPALKSKIAFCITAGKKEPKSVTDAKKIFTQLHQSRGKDKPEESGLFYETEDTNLQGTRLVSTPNLQVPGWILSFVKKRLVDELETFAWTERRRP